MTDNIVLSFGRNDSHLFKIADRGKMFKKGFQGSDSLRREQSNHIYECPKPVQPP